MRFDSTLLGSAILLPQVLAQFVYTQKNGRTRSHGSSFGTPGTDKSFDYVIRLFSLFALPRVQASLVGPIPLRYPTQVVWRQALTFNTSPILIM